MRQFQSDIFLIFMNQVKSDLHIITISTSTSFQVPYTQIDFITLVYDIAVKHII